MSHEPPAGGPPDPGQAHEPNTVPMKPLMIFVAFLVGATAIVYGVIRLQFVYYRSERPVPTERSERLPALKDAGPARPKLQDAPDSDMDAYRETQLAELRAERWIDRKAGVAEISIDEAMSILAKKGLPARGSFSSAKPGEK